MKANKVVVVLQGRHAGKAGVIVKSFDTPSKSGNARRLYPHALVLGIARYPRRVTAKMGQKKVDKRTKIKLFAKYMNYNHLMPTRYSITNKHISTKELGEEFMRDQEKKTEKLKEYAEKLQNAYKTVQKGGPDGSSHLQNFFRKLRF